MMTEFNLGGGGGGANYPFNVLLSFFYFLLNDYILIK